MYFKPYQYTYGFWVDTMEQLLLRNGAKALVHS